MSSSASAEERYRAFIENSSEGIWRFEVDEPIRTSDPPDDQITAMYKRAYLAECNDAMARMYGYLRAEEIEGARLGDMLPRDKPENVEYLRAFIQAGYRLQNAESIEIDQSGRERRFLNNLTGVIEGGRLIRAWGTQRDVTASRAAEQRLRDSEERFAKAFMANPSAMTINSLADGRYLDVNRALLRVTGYTREEIIGRTPVELGVFVNPADLPRLGARVMETGSVADEEIQLYTKDKRINTVLWSAERLELRGEPCVLTVSVDISARKAAEEELERRIEFEKQIVGIVSHDLKNPLASILMQAAAAARLQGLDERTQKMLAGIQRAAQRGSRMVSDLLDFTQARLGGAIPIEPKRLHLGDVVRQALDELRPLCEGRPLDFTIEGELEGVWDEERLGQVVSNLVSNAVKYSPPETGIAVRVRGEAEGVVLEVHNEGPPIPEERLPHLFEPLQRAAHGVDTTGRSVGLGLYIVNQVVRAHGGRVDVVSAEGQGTTFTVRLPRSAPERAAE